MSDSSWPGSDFQQAPRTDGGVALCGACRKTGQCRLGLTTEQLGDDGIARFGLTCPPEHEGGPGVAHGGWTAAVLDEALGHVVMLHDLISVTGTLTIRFEKPVPIGPPLEARAWAVRKESRKWFISGELALVSSNAVLARAEGIFVLRDPATHFANFERWLADQ
jgi:acyl-coenzyme A thioesterase PaaI-like protein